MEISDSELQRFTEESRERTKKRQQMTKALKSIATPIARKREFTGTFPRFRRLREDRYDLFMFYFNKYDDSFFIEIAQCAPDWFRRPMSAHVPPEKMTTEHLPLFERARIQPCAGRMAADCFQYGDAKTSDDFKRIAESVVPFMEQAAKMFEDFTNVQKLGRAV